MFSFQRYRVTVNPFQVHVSSQATWCSTVATLFGVWILAALFAVPSALSKYLFETLNLSSNVSYYKYVVIFVLLLSCVIPLCVIAFTYFMTARHLVESSSSISEGTQNPQHQTRRNSAKIVVGLTVVFVISYVPYHVFWTYFIWSEKILLLKFKSNLVNQSNKFQYTYLISNCFLLINPCLNPVALICTSSQFRQHLKRYLTCFCRTSSHPTDLELARRNWILNHCLHFLQLLKNLYIRKKVLSFKLRQWHLILRVCNTLHVKCSKVKYMHCHNSLNLIEFKKFQAIK